MYADLAMLALINKRLCSINIRLYVGLQQLLRGKNTGEIKKIIQAASLPALRLLFKLSPESEDFIICAAVSEVIAGRTIQ